jgi:hypothetical protein
VCGLAQKKLRRRKEKKDDYQSRPEPLVLERESQCDGNDCHSSAVKRKQQ